MAIGAIGSAIGRVLATTPGKVAAVAVGAATVGGAAFAISKLLADDRPASIKDAGAGADAVKADMVCDRGFSGRQWCREATDADIAFESSVSGSESSMLSSEDSNGY